MILPHTVHLLYPSLILLCVFPLRFLLFKDLCIGMILYQSVYVFANERERGFVLNLIVTL